MTWLNAALAFAITFLILSMVASVFVETIHRFGGMREKGLTLLLGQYYDRVLGPYLKGSGADPEQFKKSFLDVMTLNRSPSGAAGNTNIGDSETWKVSEDDSKALDGGLLSRIWSGRRLAKLTPEQFMSRLGDSEVGTIVNQVVTQSGVADPDVALHDLAAKFDAFAGEAGIFFGRRARLLSVLVAIGVAWMMYVHPFEIFKTFIQNPDVAAEVNKLQETVVEASEAQKQKSDDASGQSGSDPSLDAALKNALDEQAKLVAAGVPIGWTSERMKEVGFFRYWGIPLPTRDGWGTALWLLLGGLLVGLGGPFWHDAVKSLTSIRSLISGTKSGPNDESENLENTKPTQKAVDQFKQSQSARQVVSEQPTADDEQPVG